VYGKSMHDEFFVDVPTIIVVNYVKI
jgi:hypothetical protein